MRASRYDAICLLCGFQTGQIVGARYEPSAGCAEVAGAAAPRRLRCCRCGGSVYLEAAEQPWQGFTVLEGKSRFGV